MKDKVIVLFFPDTDENVAMATPPLPLLAVAAPLKAAGFKVCILDSRIQDCYAVEVKTIIRQALCVGISSLTGRQIFDGLKFSRFVRAVDESIPVVWGGWHPSILPEQTARDPRVDVLVRGQGELTFKELVETFASGGDLAGVRGITYRLGEEIVTTENRPFAALDDFPFMPFDLVEMRKYPGRRSTPQSIYTTFRTSQGCPFRCSFCADPLVYKRRYKMMSTERVGEELAYLVKQYGVHEVMFVDDTVLINSRRAQALAEEFLKRNLNIKWECTARAGTIAKMDEGLLQLIKDSGCSHVHPGIEGSTQEMLDFVQKDEKFENTFTCAEKLARAGIRGLFSFIIGLPGEPSYTVAETFKVIKQLKEINPENIMPVNFYMPFPGSPLYEKALAHGLEEPKTLEEWAAFSTRVGERIPWIDSTMQNEVMKRDKYYYPAAYPSEIMKKKMQRGGMKYLYRLFHRISKFRVERQYFGFDVDWWLLFRYWRLWGRFHDKLPLPNIHFRW